MLHQTTWRVWSATIAASLALLACHAQPAKKPDVDPDSGEGHAAKARDAMVGRPAPAAVIDGLDGDRVALADLRGHKPVYLKFWATWCKPCREQMPHLEAAHRKYGDRIATYAVALGLNDPIETIRAFRTEHSLTVPIAIDRDGSLAELLHVAVTPQHVLIDRAGVVRYVGHEANAELDAALEALLADPAPGDPAARPAVAAGPALALTLLDGSTFTLAGHAGRPVAVTFVSTWCDTYLKESRPAMAAACLAHAQKAEVQRRSHDRVDWMTIAHPVWTAAGDLAEFRTRTGFAAPIGLDERAQWFHHFGIRDTPVTVLFDGHGVEIARVSGAGDDLAAALARLP